MDQMTQGPMPLRESDNGVEILYTCASSLPLSWYHSEMSSFAYILVVFLGVGPSPHT